MSSSATYACRFCGTPEGLTLCEGCHVVRYCCEEHRESDRENHESFCASTGGKLGLDFSEARGRHLVARENIPVGVLMVEPVLAASPMGNYVELAEESPALCGLAAPFVGIDIRMQSSLGPLDPVFPMAAHFLSTEEGQRVTKNMDPDNMPFAVSDAAAPRECGSLAKRARLDDAEAVKWAQTYGCDKKKLLAITRAFAACAYRYESWGAHSTLVLVAGHVVSYINSSCVPNATCFFLIRGGVLHIGTRAIRPIAAGEEIAVTYGVDQQFDCTCPKCIGASDETTLSDLSATIKAEGHAAGVSNKVLSGILLASSGKKITSTTLKQTKKAMRALRGDMSVEAKCKLLMVLSVLATRNLGNDRNRVFQAMCGLDEIAIDLYNETLSSTATHDIPGLLKLAVWDSTLSVVSIFACKDGAAQSMVRLRDKVPVLKQMVDEQFGDGIDLSVGEVIGLNVFMFSPLFSVLSLEMMESDPLALIQAVARSGDPNAGVMAVALARMLNGRM